MGCESQQDKLFIHNYCHVVSHDWLIRALDELIQRLTEWLQQQDRAVVSTSARLFQSDRGCRLDSMIVPLAVKASIDRAGSCCKTIGYS
jgi:hypothetical protein